MDYKEEEIDKKIDDREEALTVWKQMKKERKERNN